MLTVVYISPLVKQHTCTCVRGTSALPTRRPMKNRATHKLFLLPAKQLIAKRIRVTHIDNTNMLILISTVESPSDAAVEREGGVGWGVGGAEPGRMVGGKKSVDG